MAILIPDESSLVMLSVKKFCKIKNAAGYHPGPVPPSTADPAPLEKLDLSIIQQKLVQNRSFGFKAVIVAVHLQN